MQEIIDEKLNPWKTKSIKTTYDNNWIEVEHHEIINPNGNDGIYGKVHFKNLAIGIIPLDENNNTWLVGQYRYPINKYSWEIPEGGGKLGVASKWTWINPISNTTSNTRFFGSIWMTRS